MSEGLIERPALRVVRGFPDADEVAAVTAVIAAVATKDRATPPRPAMRVWAAPARLIRQPLRAGKGAWASSARA